MGEPMTTDPNVVREHAWRETEEASKLWQSVKDMGLPGHVAPFSTLIAGMGPHWKPGCWDAVLAMADHTFEHGYTVTVYEEPDRCYQRYDAIGAMRNHAYMKAMQEGHQYILYADNDVKPEPDTLVRLLQRHVPVITPIIDYPDHDAIPENVTIHKIERGRGLMMAGSVVLSFLLFKTTVFTPYWQGDFWNNAIGAAEPYHWAKLRLTGHQPFIDTDVVVPVVEAPHFPLDHKPGEVPDHTLDPTVKDKIWTP